MGEQFDSVMEDITADAKIYRGHNRYLLQKIKEAEDEPDTSLLSHEDVWARLEDKYNI